MEKPKLNVFDFGVETQANGGERFFVLNSSNLMGPQRDAN